MIKLGLATGGGQTGIQIEGAQSGNGVYETQSDQLPIVVDPFNSANNPNPGQNLSVVNLATGQPDAVLFLDYDSNGLLVSGQCVQVSNSVQSENSVTISLINYERGIAPSLVVAPGQTFWIGTGGFAGAGNAFFDAEPLCATSSSMLLSGRDSNSCKASAFNGLFMIAVIVLILVLAYLLLKKPQTQ